MVWKKAEGRFVELYFDDIPSENIREALKTCGWRWYAKKHCWSNFNNEMNREFADAMCAEMNPRKPSRLEQLPVHIITSEKLLVRKNSFYCENNHSVIDLAGEIELCDRNGNIRTCLIPIAFCENCGIYYVLEETYRELKCRGAIMCQIMEYKQYINYRKASSTIHLWRENSLLNTMGYCVNSGEGLNDRQRRVILENIIDKGILTKSQVLSYLDFFVKTHPFAYEAIQKWHSDRQYIASYNIHSAKRIRIGKIMVIDRVRG